MHINLLIKRAACVYKCMQFSITQHTARELMAVCPPRPRPRHTVLGDINSPGRRYPGPPATRRPRKIIIFD